MLPLRHKFGDYGYVSGFRRRRPDVGSAAPSVHKHRPGPTGNYRKGQVRQESRHEARSRCRVRESMNTVADDGILSSDPPQKIETISFRRLRPQGRPRGAEGVIFLAVSPFT